MLDKTDHAILALLTENAKRQLREIGEQVHLTGQAVANRISRLEELDIIQKYTVVLNQAKLGKVLSAYLTVFMKTNDHAAFIAFLQQNDGVTEAHRISGDGCYLVKVVLASPEELNHFLDQLLQFGNYKLNISVAKIK